MTAIATPARTASRPTSRAAGDPSTIESVVAGPIPNSRLVPLDNNTAQRTF